MANPNHDNKGRFASKSGLNKANSTITQRGKARIKEHASDATAYVKGAAGLAIAGIGAAALQGVTRPVRVHGSIVANRAISAGIQHTEDLIARHGPSVVGAVKNAVPIAKHYAPVIGQAIASKGSTLLNHVKNMKTAGANQHSVSSMSSSAKPRVRVPMGGGSKPKVRVPMGRK